MSQVSFSFDEDEIRRCIDALYYDVMRLLERELEHVNGLTRMQLELRDRTCYRTV